MNLVKARIIRVNRGQYTVRVNGREASASLAGKLRHKGIHPVIGDYVGVQEGSDGEAVIHEVMERSSYLCRPDSGGHADGYVKTLLEQPMAANIDYLFIITSLNDDFSVNRIARYAAASIQGGCKPVVILTKADLCPDREAFLAQARQINGAWDVFCVSSHTGEGMEEVRKYLRPGVTIGLMGSSGVGKSTLINTLAGREVMKVSAIRDQDAKGRHTTTHRELLDIDGTCFIDTPGMRGFGLGDAEEGISETFDDITELMRCCRFSDCSHTSEPGCAIRAALQDGTLPAKRWQLYCNLMHESSRSKSLALKKKIAMQKKQLGK